MTNILVIGGTGTLGTAICKAYISAGAEVWFTYKTNLAKAQQLMRAGAKGYFKFDTVLDVLYPPFTISHYIDASGADRPRSFNEVTTDDLRFVFENNIIGPFRAAKQALNHMGNNGSMTFFSSSSVDSGGPRSIHYAASKAGVEAMVKGLARFASGRCIRVNAVSPGYIVSETTEGTMSPAVAQQISGILLMRLGKPSEVADAVVWLGQATYVNGQIVKVNGGMI